MPERLKQTLRELSNQIIYYIGKLVALRHAQNACWPMKTLEEYVTSHTAIAA
jgi:hypothetical protein